MLPSVFVSLNTLPLMANGKVDRRNLPSPEDKRFQLKEECVAPRTEIEEFVAQTWREVLKLETVGMYDNFFEHGGHSLLATQIVSRLRDVFDREVPLRVLFEKPSIAELSHEIENLIRQGTAPEFPPIVRMPRNDALPLSLNQEHLWRVDQIIPGTHFFNIPYVYQINGRLNVKALEKALREIIGRHEALRTVFERNEGGPTQIIKSVPSFVLEIVDLRSVHSENVTEKATDLILQERFEGFDLAEGPLIRFKLLRLTDSLNFLLITAHHIIADDWSMQVLRRELITLYESFGRGSSSPLPQPDIQFGDYACWERRLLNEGMFDAHLVYWKKQLAAVRTSSLDQEPDGGIFQFNRYSIEIKESLLQRLKFLAKEENSTLFIVVLTAVIVTLHLSTGQDNIRVGTLMANRHRRESEVAIGYFVNTVILSVKVSPELELKQLLDQVRQVVFRAYSYEEFPIEQLMRELELKREVDRACLFRVLINYQKRDSAPMNAAGLTFAPWTVSYANPEAEALPTACDLIFNFRETSTMLTGTVNVRDAIPTNGHTMDVVERLNRVLESLASDPKRLVLSVVSDFVETRNFAGA